MNKVNKQLLDALKNARSSLAGFKFIPGESNAWEPHDEQALADADEAIAAAEKAQQVDDINVVECQECGGAGERDSGGMQPWGESIMVPCVCQQPQQAVPEGYALVPVMPTKAMCEAGDKADADMLTVQLIYRAMIDAAPKGK